MQIVENPAVYHETHDVEHKAADIHNPQIRNQSKQLDR